MRLRIGKTLRPVIWIVGFLVLFCLAGVGWMSAPARGETIPGTIPPELQGQVAVVHVAPFSSNLLATAIDICDDANNQIVDGLTGIFYGQMVTVSLGPGVYDWRVAAPGTSCATTLADIAPFTVAPGSYMAVVVAGDIVNQPLMVVVSTLVPGGGNTYLPLIHKNP